MKSSASWHRSQGERVLTLEQSGSDRGGVTLVQHIYGTVMRERELLQWAREGIHRLDRAQT
jgi:hypothetical protein